MIAAGRKELVGRYSSVIRMAPQLSWPDLITPFSMAPVIVKTEDQITLDLMQFSLLPSWSRERKPKFSTYNARLESVAERASFKNAFVRRHCLVPISTFIEPIYKGDMAGNMVGFSDPRDPILSAAGIWEEWVSKSSGEIVHSFAIITHDPIPFVAQVGHDRSPLFLDPEGAEAWLNSENEKPAQLNQLLLDHRLVPPLSAAIHRPLKDGWQKRIDS